MKKEELNNFYKSITGKDLSESQLATIRILENSATAFRRKIDNSIPKEYLANAFVWDELFVIAMSYGYTVNSGYRCPELNKLVGGVPTSLHQKALAVDFNIHRDDKKIIYDSFLDSIRRQIQPRMSIKYHYKRGNMLHVELKYN